MRRDIRLAARRRFRATLCVHPRQVVVVGEELRPSDTDVAWARRVLDSCHSGVALVDGAMIDKPVVDRAHRILA